MLGVNKRIFFKMVKIREIDHTCLLLDVSRQHWSKTGHNSFYKHISFGILYVH